MAPHFRNFSMRNKLLFMMVCTSGIAIFIATIGFMYNERVFHETAKRQDVKTSAQMIAYNIGASLVFNDRTSAKELLSSLRSDPDIIDAKLYDRNDLLFASYSQEGFNDDLLTEKRDILDTFEINQTVILDQIKVGRVQLTVSEAGIQHAIKENIGVILVLALISILTSLLFAFWMQRLISGPILKVTDKMRLVTKEQDYAQRVDWQSSDELGLLADNFNLMLEQVELRDDKLARHQEILEKTVDERTQQLKAGIEELQKAEDSLNQIMQAMRQTGEAVLILNTNGKVDFINPVYLELTGYSREELEADPLVLLRLENIEEIWSKVLLGDSWKEEFECSKKDGSNFPCLLSLSPITNSSGETNQVVVILRDYSDREALEGQLRQSQKMEAVGVLVGGIAHDFNNLLAGIIGNVELAQLDIDNPEAAKKWLAKIESISFKAAETIAKLLAFARKDTVNMEAVSLTASLNEVEHLVRIGVPERIELKFDAGTHDSWVSADNHQLHQMLLNLINNGVYAVDRKGGDEPPLVEVSITQTVPDSKLRSRFSTLRKEKYARISVRDNGAGIAKVHLNKVFEPFFTTKPEGEGTGLGLSMAYGMAQSHGGAMYVKSKCGVGSEFIILLPLVTAPMKALDHVVTLAPAEFRGRGELVLIADDEALVRDSASSILLRLGYRVLVASDGIEAVELFKDYREQIHIVILDLVMPHQGGAMTAQQIKQHAPDIPVLFVSGYDLNSSRDEFDGLQDYTLLKKPYRLNELGKVLRSHLDVRQSS